MAQVPTVVAPSVNPSGPALPTQSGAGATAEAFGAGIAQSIGEFGNVLHKHELQMRQRINEADSTETYLQATTEAGQLKADYMSLEGKARVDAYPTYVENLKKVHQKYRGSLSTPDAQMMFDKDFKRRMGYDIENGASGAATALRQYEKGARSGRLDQAIREAADADDKGFALAVHDAGIAIAQEKRESGWSEEQAEAEKIKVLSQMYYNRLHSMSVTDPQRAQRIYDANKANIHPLIREKIEVDLQKGLINFNARKGGDDLWEKTKPQVGPERLGHKQGNLQGVRPELVEVLKTATRDLPEGYRAEVISGRDPRATGTTNHPGGIALDIVIYDDKGNAIPHDRSNHAGVKVYEKLYHSVLERGKEMYPDKKFVWGGAWISKAAGYGDPMHYQVVDQRIPFSSTSSGQYDPETGLPESHAFAPFFMTADERKAYRESLKTKSVQVAQVGSEGVTDAQAVEARPDLSTNRLQRALSEVPEYAAKVFPNNEGARLQLEEMLRARVVNRYNTDKKVMIEHRQALRNTIMAELLPDNQGNQSKITTVDQMSPAAQQAYLDMDPDMQRRIQGQLLANARRDVVETPERINEFNRLRGLRVTNPDQFDALIPGDYDISKKQQSALAKLQHEDRMKMRDTTKVNNALRTVMPMLNDAQVGPSTSDLGRNERFNQFVGAFDAKLKEFEEQNKKFPTEEDQRKIAAGLLTEVPSTGWFSNDRQFEVPSSFVKSVAPSFKQRYGRDPTANELFRLYEKAGRPR